MEKKYNPADDKAVVRVDKSNIPGAIPNLPLDKQVAFPTLNMSLAVTARATPLLETAMKGDHLIGVGLSTPISFVGFRSSTNLLASLFCAISETQQNGQR